MDELSSHDDARIELLPTIRPILGLGFRVHGIGCNLPSIVSLDTNNPPPARVYDLGARIELLGN